MESPILLLIMSTVGLTVIGLYGYYVKVFPKNVLMIPTIVGAVTYGVFHLLIN